jgi:ABC-type uncharacterized transport system substrate-binding protein
VVVALVAAAVVSVGLTELYFSYQDSKRALSRVEQGALFSYGIDLPLIGRTAARYVDGILRGKTPAELPVQEVPKIEFAINRETAAELGLTLRHDLIIRADERYP